MLSKFYVSLVLVLVLVPLPILVPVPVPVPVLVLVLSRSTLATLVKIRWWGKLSPQKASAVLYHVVTGII